MLAEQTIRRRLINGKVSLGSFGEFSAKYVTDDNATWLCEIWLTLEELYHKYDWWIGIYSAYDLIRYGQDSGLITPGEYDKLFNLLQN